MTAGSSPTARSAPPAVDDLLAALPVAAVIASPVRGADGAIVDFRVEQANPAAGAASGVPCELLIGALLGENLPALRETGVLDAYARVLETREPFVTDAVELDGRWAGALEVGGVFELHGVPYGDRLLVAFEDVTERRRAQERLARRETLLAQAQEMTHTGSWEWDVRSNRVTWSDELYRIYDVPPGEFGGTLEAFLALVHPDMRDEIASTVAAAVREGRPFAFEERVVRRDGSVRTLRSRGMVTETGPGGEALRVAGACQDVTEARDAAAQLEQTEQRFSELLESVGAIVWRGDAQTFEFRFVSKEAETLLGYPTERWIEDPRFWIEHMHPDDREWAPVFCAGATAKQEPHQFEYRMTAADGRTVWLRDIVRVLSRDGTPHELVGVMIDITEQKRSEAALADAIERLKDSKREAIRDLSTPVLQLRAGLLILPLVGPLDGERAALLSERLLDRIRATRARAVVVDLTGVPAFEPDVASPVVRAVESARLMGARTILSGLSAEIAASLVAQALDLRAISVAGDLEAGIEKAERLLDAAPLAR